MDGVCSQIFQRREKVNLVFVFRRHSGLTLDSLQRLSRRVLEMKQKRCNLMKARSNSNYAKNMLMAQMNPTVV